jgi:hypothetical protein
VSSSSTPCQGLLTSTAVRDLLDGQPHDEVVHRLAGFGGSFVLRHHLLAKSFHFVFLLGELFDVARVERIGAVELRVVVWADAPRSLRHFPSAVTFAANGIRSVPATVTTQGFFEDSFNKKLPLPLRGLLY